MSAKPSVPIWNPAEAARILPGCQGAWYFTGGASKVPDLSGNSNTGTIQGTAAQVAVMWGAGQYGPQLGTFAATNYVACNAVASLLTTYPRWAAILATCSTNAQQIAFSAGNNTTNNDLFALWYNNNGTGTSPGYLSYFQRDHSTASGYIGPTVNIGSSLYNGKPHVIVGCSRASNDHALYYNGSQVAQSSTSLGACVFNLAGIGALMRSVPTLPFGGGVVIAAAMGGGAVPDFAVLAENWLSGRFAEVRPARRAWLGYTPTLTGRSAYLAGLYGVAPQPAYLG